MAKSPSPAKKNPQFSHIVYVCPGCNDRFSVKEWYYSKDRWCPKCGVIFQPSVQPTKEP